MSLKLYNSATSQTEDFRSILPNQVLMYCCGPTVYDYAHIGNLRTFLFEDILTRYLEYKGYEIKFVIVNSVFRNVH